MREADVSVRDSGMTIDETATAILTAHQRRDHGSCLCGWSELGKSHPGHQVAMLREAALLNDPPAEAA
jgi:hypothetical protein